jgi:hypothetical protein
MKSRAKRVVSAVALVLAATIAAGHAARERIARVGSFADASGAVHDLDDSGVRHAVFGAPVPVAGDVNSAADEVRSTRSPDGRWLVFAVGAHGDNMELWIGECAGDTVRAPRLLTELNTSADECAPCFGANALWFASDRTGGTGGLDVYRAEFDGESFGPAEHPAGALQSARDDTDPTPLPGTDEVVIASDREGTFALYRARPLEAGFDVARISGLPGGAAREPSFSTDGRALWFALEKGGHFDIQRARLEGNAAVDPEVVPGLDTAADERAPLVIGDGFEIVFARSADDTRGFDLARVRAHEILRVPGIAWSGIELATIAALVLLVVMAFVSERWPTLDTLYRCYLASVVVHLLLLLWTQHVHVETSGPGGLDPNRKVRVKLAPADSSLTRAVRERAGDVSDLGSAARVSASVERLQLASRPEPASETAPATDVEDLRPAPEAGPEAPAREALAATPREARTTPETLRDVEVAVRRPATPAPEIALEPSALSSAPAHATIARPTRGAFAAPESAPSTSHDAAPELEALARTAPAVALDAPPPERAAVPPPAKGRANGDAVMDREVVNVGSARGVAAPPANDLLEGLDGAAVRAVSSAAPKRAQLDADRAPTTASKPALESLSAGALPDSPPPAPERSPWAGTPYEKRAAGEKERALADNGGSVETERAVERGLAYLASIQARDGHFGPADLRDAKYGQVAVGKTGLATLAFLGAGHTHISHTRWSQVVERALVFLLTVQDETSGHVGEGDAYSHGIATYTLAEAYALTKDPELRAPLERAVQRIVRAQSHATDPRLFGGWSYYFADGHSFDRWSRASITAWQVMALESARLGGIAVDDAVFADAAQFLDGCRDDDGDWYRYSHDPARLGSGYPTLPASTPASLFALSILGRDIDSGPYAASRRFVVERAPRSFRYTSESDFVNRGQGNPYFHYYGTLAMFRAGGNAWKTWNEALKRALLPAQNEDGSWTPIDVYARYARDNERDMSYTTALCVLSLEIYYRYYLPLLTAGGAR